MLCRGALPTMNPYEIIERGGPGEIGWRIYFFESLASTQEKAAELAAHGSAQGTVVIADSQSAGRGRMRRRWHSPPGVNLYLTVILRPRMAAELMPQLSLVAGVAAAEAIELVAPARVRLKWPNDLWIDGRKTGGIISETVTERGQIVAVLLGIGINVNLQAVEIPADLRETAISIRAATGESCDRPALAAALFSRLNYRYMEAERLGFDPVRPVWEGYSALTGRRVVVVSGTARETGVVRGIDVDGALMLETGTGTLRFVAGEVTVEGAYQL